MAFAAALLLFIAHISVVIAGDDDWESPVYTQIFQKPLPIPPIAQPKTTYTNSSTGRVIDYYEITIEPFTAQVYPASQGFQATNFIGYNGIAPGPTFRIPRGRETAVRFINNNNRSSAIHLHGSFSRAAWDGWADDLVPPGYNKMYYYPNSQSARTLWYHDHAFEITAINAYYGQAGFYILEDPAEDVFGLPKNQYDIPLMLASHYYNSNGQLVSPATEDQSLYGDVISVNSQPWPYLSVEPRKYRFRILDASVSRSFKLYLVANNSSSRIPMTVVGSDAGLVSSAVNTTSLVLGIAERWDVVIDFATYAGRNLTLKNERDFMDNEDYAATDRIMQFRVGSTVTSTAGNSVPGVLAGHDLPDPVANPAHTFRFERSNGQWLINGVGFADHQNRVLAHPKRGDTEQWILENSSGGWVHPVHVHLVDFMIVSRTGGRGAVEPYEQVALKDVVFLGENEKAQVRARFEPWPGLYMFHCHNLIHEDHDMLAAFNVTDLLTDFGYPEFGAFADPMDPRFQAVQGQGPFSAASVQSTELPALSALGAYDNAPAVIAALRDYWETH